MRRWILGFGTWCAALLLGTALFHALGDGSLAPPPLDPSGWGPWIAGRDVLVATMALLRLVVLGLCWYLVGVTTIGTVARLLRAARLTRLADALTLPIVRRLLQQTLGVALATTMITATTGPSLAVPATSPAQAPAGSLPEVTLRGLPAPSGDEGLPLPWRIAEADGPRVPDAPPDAPTGTGVPGPSEVPPVREEVADTRVPGVLLHDIDTDRTSHTVRSGESLWRIASQRLQVAFDRPPTDAEVVPYWRALIEANRDRLPDRDDPDLILPGQELLLPQLAAP